MTTKTETAMAQGTRSVGALYVILRYGIYLAFLILCASMAIISPRFLTWQNISNVLLQSSTIGVIAVGMTFIIVAQGIDVSVGAIVALSSAISVALMLFHGLNQYLGLLVMIAGGLIAGFVNGFSVAYLRMPAFIVTLATMQAFRGFTMVVSQGRSWYNLPPVFQAIGFGMIGPVPVTIVVAIVAFIVGHVILSRTVFGQQVYAVGGNPEAARISGINVRRTVLKVYLLGGLFTAVAGILVTSRLNSFWPTMGTGFEFDAIASVVIGGTSLSGGVGFISGTAIGVLLMGVINNALNLLNVSAFYQQVAKGAIIFVAVLVDTLKVMYSKHR
ncbi:MAG: ABC transporter permease [Firmicutes bacterium]|jgi:ribose transport system permease protein|nr:ABC transporter permease [Bacillota bacterium]MDH7495718.1 ABC transporter permease [Bacillota bacterium]